MWKQGCQWNYNDADPTHDILSVVQGMCHNHFNCDVSIDDGLLSCNTDYTFNRRFLVFNATLNQKIPKNVIYDFWVFNATLNQKDTIFYIYDFWCLMPLCTKRYKILNL
jgi:hypothetical protein